MSIQMKSEDRPKAIALVAAILAVFGFIGYRFASMAKSSVPPPPPGYNASLDMPSTSSIASGQVVASNSAPKPTGENLHEVFAGTGGFAPSGTPFRMPVGAPKPAGNPPPPGPGGIRVPTAGNPQQDIEIGGGFGPAQPGGLGGEPGSPGGPQVDFGGVRVKGIIAPQNGGQALAFIQVGDRGKGFRIGDEIAPGMKLVGISSTMVSVKIGGTIAKFGVGQEVRPG